MVQFTLLRENSAFKPACGLTFAPDETGWFFLTMSLRLWIVSAVGRIMCWTAGWTTALRLWNFSLIASSIHIRGKISVDFTVRYGTAETRLWRRGPITMRPGLGNPRRSKKESGWEHTTKLIESSVYRIVRHPFYLGSALFTLGIMLLIQSIPFTLFGFVTIVCFWMASKKEDAFNLRKFGDSYREYMRKVPMWNVLKGVVRLKLR